MKSRYIATDVCGEPVFNNRTRNYFFTSVKDARRGIRKCLDRKWLDEGEDGNEEDEHDFLFFVEVHV